MTWVERDVIRRSRMCVGFGRYLADAVPEANVVIIPNGLDLEAWPPLARSEARQALGIGEHEFVLLFVGRISPVKGVDMLLDAVGRVAPSLPDLRVQVIGPLSGSIDTRDEHVHPYARSMLELAQGLPVQFLGFISNRELKFRQHLAAADAFVLPSRSEPQGMVVLEALAMGTPVIASATGGIPDMIASDVGFVFEPGNSTALADCIRRAHERPEELRAMRSAARASVTLRYSWDSVADRHLAGFKQCSPKRDQIVGQSHAQDSTMTDDRSRTLVLGLDSIDLKLVENWASQGLLPFFAALRNGYPLVRLAALSRVLQGSIWPSILTGLSPGHHGQYYISQLVRGTYHLDRRCAGDATGERFYRHLGAHGVRCAVVDVPTDLLHGDFPGLQVVDWGTEFQYSEFSTHPRELKAEIEARFGKHLFTDYAENRL
jgi:hypothetical protein